MSNFRPTDFLTNLNPAQKEAVETIEGPVMVLAGPGSGKTQLLTSRVANILKSTDSSADNILCLTFTESTVLTMRQRLLNLIGQDAYKVKIMTFHAFCNDIIQNNYYYFDQFNLFQVADEITTFEIIENIKDQLGYNFKIKNRTHRDIISLILGLKQELITPDDLELIIKNDTDFMSQINLSLISLSPKIQRISSKTAGLFMELLNSIKQSNYQPHFKDYSLKQSLIDDLSSALEQFEETKKTATITQFKNKWLKKDQNYNYILSDLNNYLSLTEIVEIYRRYQVALKSKKLLDYPDLILTVINTLTTEKDLLYNLQEQFQYILVDEFQDTNQSQYKIIELLADNPVNNNRPNILIVGDDDQAIFSFQGANYSHMVKFYQTYDQVKLINLTTNYRSDQAIVKFSQHLVVNITDRVTNFLSHITKKLEAHNQQKGLIDRQVFQTKTDQLDYIAKLCHQLINQDKHQASEIAIIAPKHALLKELIPFLKKNDLNINYDKRDNILEDPLINYLITGCRLIDSLTRDNQFIQTDQLWSQFLSSQFLTIDPIKIWSIAEQAMNQRISWTKLIIEDPELNQVGKFVIGLSQQTNFYSIEEILDFLIGLQPLNDYQSPFYQFYFAQAKDLTFYNLLLSNLVTLKKSLTDYQKNSGKILLLADFIRYIDLVQDSQEVLLNNDAHFDHQDAISLLTVHKAKGQEYNIVILFNLTDQVWGQSTKNNHGIKLPQVLEFINYKDSLNEKIRALYVSITRAKSQLYLFSSAEQDGLAILQESLTEQGLNSPLIKPPDEFIAINPHQAQPLSNAEQINSWQRNHLDATSSSKNRLFLLDRLQTYQLSPTNLNSFVDTQYGGPQNFFIENILRLPKTIDEKLAYGNAMHGVLNQLSQSINHDQENSFDQSVKILNEFLKKQRISPHSIALLQERGQRTLQIFYQEHLDQLHQKHLSEVSFKRQGITNGPALLTGQVDRIDIDEPNHIIHLIDYKTSRSSTSIKYNYRKQLYFYIYLLQQSKEYKNWQIKASLLFLEPDENNHLPILDLNFKDKEYQQVLSLMPIVWQKIFDLDFPEISQYAKNEAGTKQFENDLIKGLI